MKRQAWQEWQLKLKRQTTAEYNHTHLIEYTITENKDTNESRSHESKRSWEWRLGLEVRHE